MATGGDERDLNLVPYMDIIVTLVLAMFVTISTLTDPNLLAQAPVDAPPPGSGEGAGIPTVGIGADGFVVGQGGAAIRLGREGGSWPYARLTEALRGLREAGEPSLSLTIHAEPAVPYSVLVATMDAARTDALGPLYPTVSLALAAR